jgi:hypothetical protein
MYGVRPFLSAARSVARLITAVIRWADRHRFGAHAGLTSHDGIEVFTNRELRCVIDDAEFRIA